MAINHPSAIAGVFKKPFAEQVAFFRNKLGKLVPTAKWDDVTRAMHDRSFMVAGAAKADLLADLAAAVDKSIAQGKGIGEFRQDFKSIVDKNGWHGWTGEGSKKGQAWRTRIIYTTNAQTSYNAGRYAQLQSFPIWVYKHNDAVLSPRVQHKSWDGLALPKEHSFWLTHSPQNGFGCECYVLGARSKNGVKRLGGDLAKQLPKDWTAIDPKTGTPVGIGKGWDYQPGESVTDVINAMANKTQHWPYTIAKAYMQSMPAKNANALSAAYRGLESTAKATQAYAAKALNKSEVAPYFTLGLLTSTQQQTIEKLLDGKVISGFDFALDSSAILHVLEEHGNDKIEAKRGQRAIVASDYAKLGGLLNGNAKITYGGTTRKTNLPVINFESEIDGEIWTVSFEYRRKRKMLVLQTFYIRR